MTHNQKKLRIGIILFLLLINGLNTFAGTILGKVIDSYTHEVVPGAGVFIDKKTTVIVTGLNGNYQFENLKPGNYIINAKSAGYENSVPQQLIINLNTDTLKFDIYIKPKTTNIDEVKVIGQKNKETDQSARTDERVASNVINIISAKTIESLPDQNVADIMQRVSGLSMSKNSFGSNSNLIIRGMPTRYNSVLVDGVVMPSTSQSGRTVSLDMFGSELVGRIEVHKSMTPDLEADAIGGTVNIKMKQAPDTAYLKIQVGSGYNQYYFNHDLLTFDNSTVMAKDFYEKNGPNYLADESVFPRKNLVINSEKALPDLNLNISGGKRFFNKKLGAMFALGGESSSMANTYDYTSYDPSFATGLPSPGYYEHQVYSKNQTRIGGYGKIDYQFNNNNNVSLYSSFFQINELRARKFADLQADENGGTYIRPLESQTETDNSGISCTALKGEHQIADNLNIDWTILYATANAQSPDFARVDEAQKLHDTVFLNYSLPLRRTWQWDIDQNKSANLNVNYKPTLFNHLFELKAGGMYRMKFRRNYANEYYFQPYDKPDPRAYEFYPWPDLLTVPLQNNQNAQEKMGNAENNPGNYRAWEDVSAMYGMVTTEIGKLQILAGLRFETTYFHGESHQNNIQVPIAITTQQYFDIFPSLNLNYKLNEQQNLRLSIYRAINRPDYKELIPYSDPRAGTVIGAPDLKPAYGNCFDMRYEIYPQKEDVFTAGVFYKKIDGAIEEILNQSNNYKPSNVLTPTTNYGLELVATKHFGKITVNANYTYTHSSIADSAIDFIYKNSVLVANPKVYYNRTLVGQSPHLFNLSLNYHTNWGFKGGITYTLKGDNLSAVDDSHLHYNRYEATYHDLGLKVEQKIGKRLFITAKVSNLLNSPVTWYMKEENNTLVRKAYNYQVYFIELRYSI